MKLKKNLLLTVVTIIACCTMTSCKKDGWCNIITTNTTTNWGCKIYFDGKIAHTDMIFEPGDSYMESFYENHTRPDLNNTIDIKVEWYKNTNREKESGKVDHDYVITDYKFDYGKDYKITIREKNFSIQQTQ